jgi:hypothetical protein
LVNSLEAQVDERISELDDEFEGDDEFEHDEEFEDDEEFERADRLGSIVEGRDGSELVLSWLRDGVETATEMLRFDAKTNLLRIFPLIRQGAGFARQYERLTELQIETTSWDPQRHSAVGDRYGLLHAIGLPKGFTATYDFGLGVMRDYRGLLEEIEDRSPCTVVRFIQSGKEGIDGSAFRVHLARFEAYRAAVDRNRGRGRVAVARVIAAERINAVGDLFGLPTAEPKYGRNAVVRAITEEVAKGYVMDADSRAALVDQIVVEAPQVAHEAPERFGKLREDIELVSLEVLIGQFEHGLRHAAGNEAHWQEFFAKNPFALQQVFAAPIVVVRDQVHVRGTDALGQGARITDFLCVNAVTRSAVVVEIKTPATSLMATTAYRGRGPAEAYAPHAQLSGAVSQVQAQMESVPRDMGDSTQLGRIDRWHVRGAVIAGRASELGNEQRESFLRYRDGLTAVTVLAFDELCERLKQLHAVLSNSSPQSSTEEQPL